jgi:hypothetical protein
LVVLDTGPGDESAGDAEPGATVGVVDDRGDSGSELLVASVDGDGDSGALLSAGVGEDVLLASDEAASLGDADISAGESLTTGDSDAMLLGVSDADGAGAAEAVAAVVLVTVTTTAGDGVST